MDQWFLLLTGALFLVVLGTALSRLGRGAGGNAWLAAWACLLASGPTTLLEAEWPPARALTLVLATLFYALLFYGTARYADAPRAWTRPLVIATLTLCAIRIAIAPFASDLVEDAVGAGLSTLAAVGSGALLLRRAPHRAQAWDRTLAAAFLAIPAVAWFQVASDLVGPAASAPIGLWLASSIMVASLQTGAFVALIDARLRDLRAEARDSHERRETLAARYRAITDHANDLIGEFDDEGRFLYANPAYETILGHPPEALIGRPASTLLFEGQDALRGTGWRRGNEPMLIVARHARGHPVTLESAIRQFYVEEGERRFVVTSRDVTHRAATERSNEEARAALERLVAERTEELRASMRELQRSNRLASMGTMAAGIAHQINNPIGSIQMSAEYALASPADDPTREATREDALRNALEQAKRCGRIVSSMLQFARNEPIDKLVVDLVPIARRACEQIERSAAATGASLDASDLQGPLPVLASEIELEQAFLNVLRNACEAAAPGRGVAIVVRAARSEGHAVLSIEDDGRGMTETEIEQAFDPFFTTRLGRGGTGLGLSVAHGVIADHAGHLSIESKPGRGTQITISVPLADEVDASTSEDPLDTTGVERAGADAGAD